MKKTVEVERLAAAWKYGFLTAAPTLKNPTGVGCRCSTARVRETKRAQEDVSDRVQAWGYLVCATRELSSRLSHCDGRLYGGLMRGRCTAEISIALVWSKTGFIEAHNPCLASLLMSMAFCCLLPRANSCQIGTTPAGSYLAICTNFNKHARQADADVLGAPSPIRDGSCSREIRC